MAAVRCPVTSDSPSILSEKRSVSISACQRLAPVKIDPGALEPYFIAENPNPSL
jgi:hypothetical protein